MTMKPALQKIKQLYIQGLENIADLITRTQETTLLLGDERKKIQKDPAMINQHTSTPLR